MLHFVQVRYRSWLESRVIQDPIKSAGDLLTHAENTSRDGEKEGSSSRNRHSLYFRNAFIRPFYSALPYRHSEGLLKRAVRLQHTAQRMCGGCSHLSMLVLYMARSS